MASNKTNENKTKRKTTKKVTSKNNVTEKLQRKIILREPEKTHPKRQKEFR